MTSIYIYIYIKIKKKKDTYVFEFTTDDFAIIRKMIFVAKDKVYCVRDQTVLILWFEKVES